MAADDGPHNPGAGKGLSASSASGTGGNLANGTRVRVVRAYSGQLLPREEMRTGETSSFAHGWYYCLMDDCGQVKILDFRRERTRERAQYYAFCTSHPFLRRLPRSRTTDGTASSWWATTTTAPSASARLSHPRPLLPRRRRPPLGADRPGRVAGKRAGRSRLPLSACLIFRLVEGDGFLRGRSRD